jgi:hypothetical protein
VRRFIFFCFVTSPLAAYSVLSHEELIDISGIPEIRPTAEALSIGHTTRNAEAHAYAYGGSIKSRPWQLSTGQP